MTWRFEPPGAAKWRFQPPSLYLGYLTIPCDFCSALEGSSVATFGMQVAIAGIMSPRDSLKKNLEAAIVVALSTGLAIVGAHHVEQSEPDHELLQQLRGKQTVIRLEKEEGSRASARGTPPLYALR